MHNKKHGRCNLSCSRKNKYLEKITKKINVEAFCRKKDRSTLSLQNKKRTSQSTATGVGHLYFALPIPSASPILAPHQNVAFI